MENEVSETLLPRDNTYLLGHEEAERIFLNAWQKGSLHNSWLISGVKGVGKATLAYRLARFILSADFSNKDNYTSLDVPPNLSVINLISNGSHPDFKVLERDYTDTERKKILKAIKDGEQLSQSELKEMKKSSFIRVDDVRTINEFLSRRSSQDGWRVVLIDSVDDMNTASANAVLKILEEPPHQALMLLVSHNPGGLLATIRSRCAKLALKPLQDNQVASLLRRYRPHLSEAQIKKVVAISSGSIGKALNYIDNEAITRYDDLCKIILSGRQFKISALTDFCNEAVSGEESFELSKELLFKFLSEKVKTSSNPQGLSEAWEIALKTFRETETLNMDKRQALMNIIVNISKQF